MANHSYHLMSITPIKNNSLELTGNRNCVTVINDQKFFPSKFTPQLSVCVVWLKNNLWHLLYEPLGHMWFILMYKISRNEMKSFRKSKDLQLDFKICKENWFSWRWGMFQTITLPHPLKWLQSDLLIGRQMIFGVHCGLIVFTFTHSRKVSLENFALVLDSRCEVSWLSSLGVKE